MQILKRRSAFGPVGSIKPCARTAAGLLAVAALAAPPAQAHTPPFPCADPAWFPGELNASFAGQPGISTVWDPDGPGPLPEVWVVSGFVYSASGKLMNNIAVWNGTAWSSLGGGLKSSSIHALLPWNGRLVAAGLLDQAGGAPVKNIAQWDPDAQTWSGFGNGLGGTSQRVYALAEYADQLVAAGTFVASGSKPVLRIAMWSGSDWGPLGAGLQPQSLTPSASIYGRDLAVKGSDLYVVGTFTKAGGVTVTSIARWDGISWWPVGLDAANFTGMLRAVAVYGDALYAGGTFAAIAGLPANNIAKWDGAAWSPLAGGLTSSGTVEVQRLRVAQGKLHAGGTFSKADGKTASLIAAWDGQAWSSLPGQGNSTTISPSPGIGGIDAFGGQIHMAGSIFEFYGVESDGVLRWDGTANWSRVGPDGFYDGVADMTEHDGKMLVVGGLTKSAALEKTLIGDPSGWTQFASVPTPWGAGLAVVSTPDGAIVSGSGISGGIARWDGASWVKLGSGFVKAPFVWGLAYDLLRRDDGTLFAGGQFVSAGDTPAANIAMWDGQAWSSLGAGLTGTGTDISVRSLVEWQDTLVAGGRFNAAGGQPALNIARWDGAAWSPLGAGLSGGTIPVYALADWNGQLLAAGEKTSVVPGGAGTDIARWNPATASWEVLATVSHPLTPAVFALRPADTSLLVGGSFDTIDGVPIPNLAIFDGSAWAPFYGGVDGPVGSIALFGDHVCVGGGFTTVGGNTPSAAVAWLSCQPPACPADCDASGGLNIDDFICFQTFFALGDPAADCDASGGLNIDDFICFQTNFALGC